MKKRHNRTGDYGIDAPYVIRNLFLGGIGFLLAGIAAFWWIPEKPEWLGRIIRCLFPASFVVMSAEAAYMLWSSKVGKYLERERLLDLVALQGHERVLDIGCGRGLVLNAAARRLTTGKAIGIDIWSKRDQTGNSPEAARKNSVREGVAERVEIADGDARAIPFADHSFDVVVSSLAIHNIPDPGERHRAICEIVRVLKPLGRFAILDFQHVREYAGEFVRLGMEDVRIVGPHWLMFPPVRIVTGVKGGGYSEGIHPSRIRDESVRD
jgi:SAM-dependent methyltransferase